MPNIGDTRVFRYSIPGRPNRFRAEMWNFNNCVFTKPQWTPLTTSKNTLEEAAAIAERVAYEHKETFLGEFPERGIITA